MNLRMSTRSTLLLGLALWLTLPCASAIGQAHNNQILADNDSARFVGTWELASVEARWPDGHVTSPWGTHPPGRLIYTNEGRMIVLCMHEERNAATHGNLIPELQNEAAGYFGTFKVDAVRHIVSHTITATLRPTESGTISRIYEFKDKDLYLSAEATRDGHPVTYVLVWKRA